MKKPQQKIEKLILRKFRGATTETIIDFSDKKIALLFGENGTGKSTVIDAIDFICNKQIGSLKDKSSTKPKEHLPAIGFQIKDVSVDLHSGDNMWTGRHNGKDVIIEGEEALPTVFILRRNRLLRLVEAQPSERYNELRGFIEVNNIEKCEQTLHAAVKDAESQYNRFVALQNEAETALNSFWQSDNNTDLSPVEWAKQKAKADLSANKKILGELGTILKLFLEFQQQENDYSNASAKLETARKETESIESAILAQKSATDSENFKLIELLRVLESVISVPTFQNECPACQTTYDIEELRRQTQQRLAALRSAEDLQNQLKTKKREQTQAEAVRQNSRTNLIKAAESFASAILSYDFLSGKLQESERRSFKNLVNQNGKFATVAELADFTAAAQRINQFVLAQYEDLQKDINQFDAIKKSVERYEESVSQTLEEARISPRLQAAFDIVRRTRIEFTQTILNEVSADCAEFFSKIHPNEPYSLTGLRLEEDKKGSLHQTADFDEHKNVVPQAYFSESHLDTLGFCFWLAIAKKASGGNAVLVLDDAFTSVDSKHIERIVELLVEESKNFNQIIVSTHQRRWFNLYKYKLGNDKSKVLEFGRWGKNRGITIYTGKSEFAQLTELLTAPVLDRQAIVSKAGVLLEKIFDDLTILFACSVKRKAENTYTLDELHGFTSKLFDAVSVELPKRDDGGIVVEPVEYEKKSLKNLHTKIKDFIAIRNHVGAHYNILAEEYTDDKIEEIGKIALELASELTCPKCRNFGFRKLSDDKTHRFCGCKGKDAPLKITPPSL